MRFVILIAAALAALGWLLAIADTSGSGVVEDLRPVAVRRHGDWRRTASGWENSAVWQPPSPVKRPPFHPGLLAAFEVWTAIAAVVTASPKRTAEPGDAA